MPKAPRGFDDRREELLRRFGMPSCAELHVILQKDDKLPDAVKLNYIKEYEAGLQDLCRQVARETASSGEKVVDGVLNVAQATLTQLRVGILSYSEQVIGSSGFMVQSAMYQDCVRAMRAGNDCNALWQLEQELQKRLQQTSAWTSKVWDYVNQAVSLVQKGGQILLKTAKEGVVAVFGGVWQLFKFFLPYIVKVTGYMFSSPRAAVLAFMYAKHMQKRICRFVARAYLMSGKPVPQATMKSQLSEMGSTANDYFQNVGMSQIASGLGSVVKDTLMNHSDTLVNSAVGMVSVGFPLAAPLAMLVGGMVKGAVKVSSEVMQDAAEYAVFQKDMDNAFTKLYEVLSFGECVKAWKETTTLSGRVNRYENNRLRIQTMDKAEYVRVRSEEILRTMKSPANDQEIEGQKKVAWEMAKDELNLHGEIGNDPQYAGSAAKKWIGGDGVPDA